MLLASQWLAAMRVRCVMLSVAALLGPDRASAGPSHDMALFAATGKDDPAKIRLALDAGADLNARHTEMNYITPLILASIHGRGKSVDILLKMGADTTLADKDGLTAVHAAAYHGQWGVVSLLHRAGADLDTVAPDGYTPLFRACWGMENHHTDTVNILLSAGVEFQRRRNGHLPVQMVKYKPTFDLLKKAKDRADAAGDVPPAESDPDSLSPTQETTQRGVGYTLQQKQRRQQATTRDL